MTAFIRKNDDDGSIDRACLTRQFEGHLIDGRRRDVVALLELIAGHDPAVTDGVTDDLGPMSPPASMDLRSSAGQPLGGAAEPSMKQVCVPLDELSEWVTTAMHANGDAPSSPGSAAIIDDARVAILAVAGDQLAAVIPDAWIGLAGDVDGAVLGGELAVDHRTISYDEYRNSLNWLPLLRMATDIGVAHNERLAIAG